MDIFFKLVEDKTQSRALTCTCNMNAFFSFDLFMVYNYIPECKQQLRTMK